MILEKIEIESNGLSGRIVKRSEYRMQCEKCGKEWRAVMPDEKRLKNCYQCRKRFKKGYL